VASAMILSRTVRLASHRDWAALSSVRFQPRAAVRHFTADVYAGTVEPFRVARPEAVGLARANHMRDENGLTGVIDQRDEAVLVSSDVEDRRRSS